MSLAARHQADATAAGAAELARALAAGEVDRPGIWLPEEVISHERFFGALATRGWQTAVDESPAGPGSSGSKRGRAPASASPEAP